MMDRIDNKNKDVEALKKTISEMMKTLKAGKMDLSNPQLYESQFACLSDIFEKQIQLLRIRNQAIEDALKEKERKEIKSVKLDGIDLNGLM